MAERSATPLAPKSIDTLLDEARSGALRLDPHEAQVAMAAGALIIDIRSEAQRRAHGMVPGALAVDRNVLEWRCDPGCPARDPRIDSLRALIVMCNQGFQSSLAAATLRALGRDATDLIGGFQAWRAAGLPIDQFTEPTLMRAVECPCGHHLEGADDEELFRQAREHIRRGHPELLRSDAQLSERIAADAYDLYATAPRVRIEQYRDTRQPHRPARRGPADLR
jgi:rhodanese-related sulfurtransferase/predicted small metal-binding protein